MRTFALLAVLLSPSVAAADTVYRWTDAAGQVHFSDDPSVSVATEFRLRPSPQRGAERPRGGVRRGEKTLLRDAAERRKREISQRRKERKKWRQAQAKRAKTCAQTRQRLAELRSPRTGWEERRRILKKRRALRCFGER